MRIGISGTLSENEYNNRKKSNATYTQAVMLQYRTVFHGMKLEMIE